MVKKPIAPAASLGIAILMLWIGSCDAQRDWITFRGEQGRGATPNAVRPPLGVKWKLRLQIDEKPAPAFNASVVVGDTIYFGSADGNFYALDIESGYMRWVFRTKGEINSVPTADGENVYFGSNYGTAYAVSLRDGRLAWSYAAGRPIQSSMVRYGDKVIFTSDAGATFILSTQGKLLYTIPNLIWYLDTFQVFNDVIYLAPGPPEKPFSFGAFDLNRRGYLWVMDAEELDATWFSFPVLSGNRLFFATCEDRSRYWELNYYACDRRNGRLIWKRSEDSILPDMTVAESGALFQENMKRLDYLAPSLWRNLVIYTSGDTVVRAFHAENGKLAWKRQFDSPTSSPPLVAGDRLYFGLMDGGSAAHRRNPSLVCLSARTGSLVWQMDLEGALVSSPVIAGKRLIFGTNKNVFYVIEELL